jgi:hypothetical protein
VLGVFAVTVAVAVAVVVAVTIAVANAVVGGVGVALGTEMEMGGRVCGRAVRVRSRRLSISMIWTGDGTFGSVAIGGSPFTAARPVMALFRSSETETEIVVSSVVSAQK